MICEHCGNNVDHLVVEVREWNKYTVNIEESLDHDVDWSAAEPMEGSPEGAIFYCPECRKPVYRWTKHANYSIEEAARRALGNQ